MPVKPGDFMLGVGYAGEGHLVTYPEVRKGFGVLRPYGDDLGLTVDELSIVLAQPRHVPPAVGSAETAVKHQHDVLLAGIVREFNRIAGGIGRGKIGRGGVRTFI